MCAAWMNDSQGMASELERISQVAGEEIHLSCLLLDDDPIDRRYVHWLLQQLAGFRFDVTFADSLNEAKQLCSEKRFDLYLFDYWMGEDSSASLVSFLREEGDNAGTIVVLSSLDDASFQDVSLKSGADMFLAKQELSAKTLERMLRNIAQIASNARLQYHQKQLDADKIGGWLKHINGGLDQSHGFAVLALDALKAGRGQEAEHLISDALEQIAALRNEVSYVGVGMSMLNKESALNLKPFDVSSILTEVVEDCRFEAEQFGKTLNFCEHVADSIVLSDEGLLRELLFVLLRGAVRYSGERTDVAVSYELGTEALVVYISEFGSAEDHGLDLRKFDVSGTISLAYLFGTERAGSLLVAEHILQILGGDWSVGYANRNLEIRCRIPLNVDLLSDDSSDQP